MKEIDSILLLKTSQQHRVSDYNIKNYQSLMNNTKTIKS